jgi:mannose-1-phosphate guanylyltransferase/mannose-6-phosphate isomerase
MSRKTKNKLTTNKQLLRNLYAVIIAGGSGTRFWPLSREDTPKQLLKIVGDKTLIQSTLLRISPLVAWEHTYIVTNPKQVESINFQLSAVTGRSWDTRFIIEPEPKNTAPAIGLAAVHIKNINSNAIMFVFPSDHLIKDNDKFCEVMLQTVKVASEGYLVTIGIVPDRPETGYGYIKCGKKIKNTAYRVEEFKEKPDKEKAIEYLQRGNYYWNSGIFIWKVTTILNAIKNYMPELYKGLVKIEKTLGTEKEKESMKAVFSILKSESIDYGVLEKADKVAMIPADMGWSDVGSWHALEHILPIDRDNNVKQGNIISIDNKNSILYCDKRLVAAVGLDGMIVVDTPDAVLICPKDRAQDVKKIVDILKKRGAKECLAHIEQKVQ